MSSEQVTLTPTDGPSVPVPDHPVESAILTTTVQVPTSNPLPITVTSTDWQDVVTQDISKVPANSVLILVAVLVFVAAALYSFLLIEAIIEHNTLAEDWVGRASVAIAFALGGGTLLNSQFHGPKK